MGANSLIKERNIVEHASLTHFDSSLLTSNQLSSFTTLKHLFESGTDHVEMDGERGEATEALL